VLGEEVGCRIYSLAANLGPVPGFCYQARSELGVRCCSSIEEPGHAPGFFFLWRINVRRGSIFRLQGPLSGRDFCSLRGNAVFRTLPNENNWPGAAVHDEALSVTLSARTVSRRAT
jgi:hypothetical protein